MFITVLLGNGKIKHCFMV